MESLEPRRRRVGRGKIGIKEAKLRRAESQFHAAWSELLKRRVGGTRKGRVTPKNRNWIVNANLTGM